MPDPEQPARIDIDRQLCLAGWIVQDKSALNLTAGPGVAIREVSIPGAGEADYLLVARDKANLDIFWLRDESLDDAANLEEPDVIAAEIIEDLQAALDEFALIYADLATE
jgi:hypothetical protein